MTTTTALWRNTASGFLYCRDNVPVYGTIRQAEMLVLLGFLLFASLCKTQFNSYPEAGIGGIKVEVKKQRQDSELDGISSPAGH